MIIAAGATDVSLYVYFVDDDGGTAPGEPTTGLLFSDIETGGSASYVRQGEARADLTLITLASASAVHADGGFILVDNTNMPGLYRVDFPDAAFATGVDFVIVQIVAEGTNNTIMRPLLIDLSPDVNVATWLGTAPNALVSGRVDGSVGAMAATVLTAAAIAATALDGKGDWNINKTGYSLTQAFPTNFADLAIAVTTGRIDLGLWLGTAPLALTAQRVAALVGAMATDVLTAAALNADAVQEIADKILIPKNAEYTPGFNFLMVDSTDHVTEETGLTVTAQKSIDAVDSFSAATGVVTEIGNGVYRFVPSAADVNGTNIQFKFTATGADTAEVNVRTAG